MTKFGNGAKTLLAIAVLAAVMFISCPKEAEDSDDRTYTGYDPDGYSYTLEITQGSNGDTYILTIKVPAGTAIGTSTGTVKTTSGSTITLVCGGIEFTVTISGNAISGITADGGIPVSGGGTIPAPPSLSPNNPGPSNQTVSLCTIYNTGDYYVNGTKRGKLDIPAGTQISFNRLNCFIRGGKVYVWEYNSSSEKITYWVDGVRKDITAPAGYNDINRNSFTVSDGKVYVLGNYGNYSSSSTTKYCYWVDGVRKDLDIPNGYTSRDIYSLTVSNGKVYTAGSYSSYTTDEYGYNNVDDNRRKACYWVDGVRTDLSVPAGYEDSRAYNIIVSDGKVYVSGNYRSYRIDENGNFYDEIIKACYWVDGVRKDLDIPAGTERSEAGITVSGGKVYAAGQYGNLVDYRYMFKACYWVDGVRTDLSVPAGTDSHAGYITVSGGKVYIRGAGVTDNGTQKHFYWADGVRTDLVIPDDGMTAEAYWTYFLTVSDGKVYVIGDSCPDVSWRWETNFYRGVFYWVDGVRRNIDVDLGGFFAGFGSRYFAVADGKVHIAASGGMRDSGSAGDTPITEAAWYWIDGVKQALPDAANIVAISLTTE